MDARMNRQGFVAMTGAASLAAFLAACGGSGGGSSSAAADATTAAAKGFDPATEPDAPLSVFTWSGYDDDPKAGLPAMWQQYKDGPYGSKSPLTFTLLDDDTQALAKVASGFNPDIIHPCSGYVAKWKEAGLIQPLDISLLPEWDGITASLKEAGNLDGAYYHLPFDTGFTSLTYDADVIEFPDGEETWAVLLDPRYKGKLSIFNGPDEVIEIAALINRGAKDPMTLTLDELAAAKETALQMKPNLRNYWTSETDVVNDFVNGNIVAASTWNSGFLNVRNHPKMKGRNIKYMQPKEGRMVWVCGTVLSAQSQQPGRAMTAMASINTPEAAAALTNGFGYASAQQQGTQDLLDNKELITLFGLDDPTLWSPPKGWIQKQVEPYKEYIAAGQEVINA
jgi:spermidine/putrescine-binding protein